MRKERIGSGIPLIGPKRTKAPQRQRKGDAHSRVCRLIIPLSDITFPSHRAAHYLGWTSHTHIPPCPLSSDNHVRPLPRPKALRNQLHPGSPTRRRRNRRTSAASPWDPRRRTGVTRALFPPGAGSFRTRITCSTSGPRSRGTSSPRRARPRPGSSVPRRTSAPAQLRLIWRWAGCATSAPGRIWRVLGSGMAG